MILHLIPLFQILFKCLDYFGVSIHERSFRPASFHLGDCTILVWQTVTPTCDVESTFKEQTASSKELGGEEMGSAWRRTMLSA